LYLWDQNFYHNKLGKGKDSLIQQVLTPGVLNSGEKLDYAFGLVIGNYRGLKMISHSGGFVGFQVEMLRFPEQRFSVICLANLSTINPERLARQVANIYLAGESKDSPREVESIELPRETPADKVGVYRSFTSGQVVELSLPNGSLVAEMSGERFPIAPITETDFLTVAAPFDAQIRFERSGQGELWLMHVHVEGERPDTLEMIEVVSPSTDQLAEYAGEYYSTELQVTYAFVLEDGKLFVRHKSAPREPLKPGIDDMFWVDAITFLFTRDAKGRVSGFTLNTERARKIRFARTRSE
jgi:hypothetical protein